MRLYPNRAVNSATNTLDAQRVVVKTPNVLKSDFIILKLSVSVFIYSKWQTLINYKHNQEDVPLVPYK